MIGPLSITKWWCCKIRDIREDCTVSVGITAAATNVVKGMNQPSLASPPSFDKSLTPKGMLNTQDKGSIIH